MADLQTAWPHQDKALHLSRGCWKSGVRSWCIVAPCGAGKSYIMRRLALPAAERGLTVCIYLHRVMLTKQTIEAFEETGVEFGVIASGWGRYKKPAAKIQICSLGTVNARMQRLDFEVPKADLVIVDEAHQQVAGMAQSVFDYHAEMGARRIGFTATPVDLGSMYDRLVVAANYSEMISCGAHLPIRCYGPDCPDTSGLKRLKSGDFSSKDDARINKVPTIFGRVLDHWRQLNPDQLPAIGFAPGVEESRWFVRLFQQAGVACAHIDGERVLVVDPDSSGQLVAEELPNTDESRSRVMEGSRTGRYKIVWNRFVLREAIDMPWLYHAISATSMGGLSTYLQSIGRVQRFWPDYDHVILQDHGGNIDRHGLPDEDRDWSLGCSNRSISKAETKKRQDTPGDEAEPISCPKCCGYRLSGPQCPHCGYMHKRSVRMVRQLDGALVRKTGRLVKHKPAKTYESILRGALFGAYRNGKTVGQALWMADQRAQAAGVTERNPGRIDVPAWDSIDRERSVREVYPWAKPKGKARK